MVINGKAWKYEDDINTDYIFPGSYTYILMSDEEMGTHAMEGYDTTFTEQAKPGDIIVAGKNWGCGSSREQAVKCLKARGIGAIIAKGYSRIFYRNALNEGFLIIVCPEAVDGIQNGEEVAIDFDEGIISCNGNSYKFPQYPKVVRDLVECGGLLNKIKATLKEEGKI